jgi:hypothetical protein
VDSIWTPEFRLERSRDFLRSNQSRGLWFRGCTAGWKPKTWSLPWPI